MFAASKTDGVVAGGPPPSGDPYWSNVSLLTNFENNLTFRDESTNNIALTRTGVVNPSLNIPFSGGVGGSEYFSGSSSYLSGPNIAALQMGTGDYTVEFWMYQTSVAGGQVVIEVGRPAISGVGFQIDTISGVIQVYGGATTGTLLITAGSTQVTNTWYHIALTRQGTNTKLFINGTQSGSTATDSTSYTQAFVWIGANSFGGSAYFRGFISNLRIVKGTAVYTANFTPPTAPLTAITNTSLLITGTGQGMFNNATFVDQGPNALTVTATGAPVYSGRSPFGNTYPGSVLFSGTGQYLSVPNSAPLQLTNSTAFTLECWIYPTVVAVGKYIMTNYNQSSPYGGYGFGIGCDNFNSQLQFWDGGSWRYFGAITANTWTHIAITYQGSGTTGLVFVNGVQQGSAFTVNANISYTAGNALIGAQSASTGFFSGYISNARVVKGTAVYTANFTPSTTPLTAITNTSLLVRGDTGAFYDLSNNGNSMTSTGTTAVTTQVKKYGAESASYTATAYQTVVDAVNLQLGTGDYTIEAWVYRNAAGVLHSLICKGAAATGWLLQVNSSNQLVFTVTSTAILTSTTTIAATTWTFVTVTRSGTSTRLFVSGNLEATATDSTNFNQTNALLVGADRSNANGLNGYLDDIRITKGVARYTANFTPPTATFPTGS